MLGVTPKGTEVGIRTVVRRVFVHESRGRTHEIEAEDCEWAELYMVGKITPIEKSSPDFPPGGHSVARG